MVVRLNQRAVRLMKSHWNLYHAEFTTAKQLRGKRKTTVLLTTSNNRIQGAKVWLDAQKPSVGWRTWGENNDRCDHCCNGDRCDDSTHLDRRNCGYCLGTGDALWLKYEEPQSV
jgi:hypothetical protein